MIICFMAGVDRKSVEIHCCHAMGSNDSGTLGNLSAIDDCFTANLPTSLFHYTDAGGFLGILSTRSIWATDSSCLSDRQELLYAKELITDQLDILCSHPDWNPEFRLTHDETKLLDSIRSSFRSTQHVSDIFVASFSTEFDSLSQWREYGSYNIGISGAALRASVQQLHPHALLARCIYDQPIQWPIVHRVVQLTIQDYRTHNNSELLERDMISRLYRYGPLLKHDSFSEEAEWRIVIPGLSQCLSLRFRQANRLIVPYVSIDIETALKTRNDAPVLPLINLGPGIDRVKERTVEHLTEQTLGFRAFVHRSDTPYLPGD